jgi:hypothetical protein
VLIAALRVNGKADAQRTYRCPDARSLPTTGFA